MKRRAAGERKKSTWRLLSAQLLYGITNIAVDFVWSVAELVLLGSTLSATVAAEVMSIPATIINAGFTVIGIALLYIPVSSAYRRIG